jgi:hypothetical protein
MEAPVAVLLDRSLRTIPAEYLPFLIDKNVQRLRKHLPKDFMLFPMVAGFISWLFAVLLIIVLVMAYFSEELDYDALPTGLMLIAALVAIPLIIMALRKLFFMHRNRAYNEGVMKTRDAYLLRFKKSLFSLIPYESVVEVRLGKGYSTFAGHSASAYIALEIEYRDGAGTSVYRLSDFIFGSYPYYGDSQEKRAAAEFFGKHFKENEFSSAALWEKTRTKV